jgi:hypothetical protein
VSKTIGKTFALSSEPKIKVELPKAEPDTGETDLAREDDGSVETILDSSALEVFEDAAQRFDKAGRSDMSRIVRNWPLTNGTLSSRNQSIGDYLLSLNALIRKNMEPSSSVAKEINAGKKSSAAFTQPQNLIDAYASKDVAPIATFIMDEVLFDHIEDIQAAAEQTNDTALLNVLKNY